MSVAMLEFESYREDDFQVRLKYALKVNNH